MVAVRNGHAAALPVPIESLVMVEYSLSLPVYSFVFILWIKITNYFAVRDVAVLVGFMSPTAMDPHTFGFLQGKSLLKGLLGICIMGLTLVLRFGKRRRTRAIHRLQQYEVLPW